MDDEELCERIDELLPQLAQYKADMSPALKLRLQELEDVISLLRALQEEDDD